MTSPHRRAFRFAAIFFGLCVLTHLALKKMGVGPNWIRVLVECALYLPLAIVYDVKERRKVSDDSHNQAL